MRYTRHILSAMLLWAGLLCVGCGGQVQVLEFGQQEVDLFESYQTHDIQGVLQFQDPANPLTNCAQAGCHDDPGQANFLIVPDPNGEQLNANYQSARSFIDTENPLNSRLLTAAVNTDETNPHIAPGFLCYESEENCCYTKILAWVQSATDPSVQPPDCVCGDP